MATPLNDYTEEQIQSIHTCYTNPVHFISNYCLVNTPTRGHLLMNPTDKQIQLINTLNDRSSCHAIHVDRQEGKTSASLAYLLWCVIFKVNTNCVFVSIKKSNSDDSRYTFMSMYDMLPECLKLQITRKTPSTIEFENGSRIFFTSTNKILNGCLRGSTISLCILDEFYFYQKPEDLLDVIMPNTFSNGSCKIVSSENPHKSIPVSGFKHIML